MKTITLVGAGGKMGCRLTDNLIKTKYKIHYLEVSTSGLENLRQRSLSVSRQQEAVPMSDIVILAVPDVAIGEVAQEIVPQMKPGSLLMTLDPAAPLAGQLPHREDIGCVITHPCHPSVFNWEPTEKAFRDFYGGISAKQAIVVALMWGGESYYELGVEISVAMYAPVSYHPQPETVIAVLRETVSLLDGLLLALENHDRFPAATLRAIVESAGSARVGVCLDTANSLGAGEGLDTVLSTLAPLTVNLHIKDFHIERLPCLMGFTVNGRPAGHGFLNLPFLLKQLTPFGRCRTAVLELWTRPSRDSRKLSPRKRLGPPKASAT